MSQVSQLDTSRHLCLYRKGKVFAIQIQDVEIVTHCQHIRPLPHALDYFKGFYLFRERILPIIEPFSMLKGIHIDLQPSQTIVVLRMEGYPILGIAIDSTGEMLELNINQLSPIKSTVSSAFLGVYQTPANEENATGQTIHVFNFHGLLEVTGVSDHRHPFLHRPAPRQHA